jgi:phosphonate transport system substrate-binding protein
VHYLVFATGPQGFGPAGAELRQKLALILSSEVGARVDVVAVSTYGELLRGIERGTAQAAWCPPAVFVRANAVPICRAVRHGATSFRAALYTRADSGIDELRELEGASMAWVDWYSCSGYLFPRLALADRGIELSSLASQRFYGSQGAAARAVLSGEANVGAGYLHLDPDGKILRGSYTQIDPNAEMRVLLVTDPVPSDTICVSSSIDEETQARLAASLANLEANKEGRSILEGLFQCAWLEEGFDPSDYDIVRRAALAFASELEAEPQRA